MSLLLPSYPSFFSSSSSSSFIARMPVALASLDAVAFQRGASLADPPVPLNGLLLALALETFQSQLLRLKGCNFTAQARAGPHHAMPLL